MALIAAPLCAVAPPALAQDEAGKPVPPPFAAGPEDGQWTMPAKNVASTRYSGLDEITTDNVKNLKVAFTFSLGYNKGQEAAPLVIDNTMYIVSSYPNVLYALDLTKPGAPLKWKYEPKPAAASQGVACCDVVNRGAAYANGKLFFNTLDDFTIAVDANNGKDLGVSSWPADAWRQGGGTVWGWASYDPDLNLVYYGTANPGPWNADMRPGDNKWTAGIFARDADTGQARWYYQFNPHDIFDHDGVNENILVDIQWKGQPRKVLLHPDRNGYLYMMDRTSGEVLSANAFDYINSSTGVDLKTGRLQYVKEKETKPNEVVRDIRPAPPGAKDWQPSSFSPKTGLLYIPHNHLCMDMEEVEVGYIEGTPYVGANVHMKPGPGGYRGAVSAFDFIQGKEIWSVKENFPAWSGALTTGGDVVFYGTMEGWFKALDAKTGALLWQFKTGSGIISQPTTYKGPDSKQYVAVLSGVGGWAGAIVSGQLDKRDGTSALGFVNAMKDLPDVTTPGGELYVFSLP